MSTCSPKLSCGNMRAGYDATVQRFHCCGQDGCACCRQHHQDEPSAMGWNERCVVLLSHEYALGRACQVRRLQRSRRHWQEGHQQTVVEAVCAKVASSCPRKRKLLPYEDKELFTRNSVEWKEWAIPEIHPYSVQDRTECRYSARRERVARQEGAVARRSCVASSPHNQFWGSVIFRVI